MVYLKHSRAISRPRLTITDYPDPPGLGRYNVTSFYRKHIHWGPERENRPEIDFAWEEDQDVNPRPKFPGYMFHEVNGKKYIVLDPHDNPIKDWDIPATIASNYPGYKLEALRRENMSLGHKDCKYSSYLISNNSLALIYRQFGRVCQGRSTSAPKINPSGRSSGTPTLQSICRWSVSGSTPACAAGRSARKR